jgi:hypothetical protein
MRKEKFTTKVDKDLLEHMEKIRDDTGFPISRQIDLKLKGYKLTKDDKMNNENMEEDTIDMQERIKDVLEDVKEGGLTKDSISMVICLENEIDRLDNEIDMATSLIRLIKDKKVYAEYEGDRNESYDVDQFRIIKKENGKDDDSTKDKI